MLPFEEGLLISMINFVKNGFLYSFVVFSYDQITPVLEFSLYAVKVNEALFVMGMFY